jgi:hypothetical protein
MVFPPGSLSGLSIVVFDVESDKQHFGSLYLCLLRGLCYSKDRKPSRNSKAAATAVARSGYAWLMLSEIFSPALL